MTIIGKGAAGRAYTVGKYGLEIKGNMAGWVKELDGGHAVADVIAEKVGADHLQRKHLGPLKYEEISLKAGAAMSKDFFEWINTGFNQTSYSAGRRDGACVFANYDNEEISRLTFTNGLITEFGMPALDASSKDAALLSLKFQPEITKKETRGGGKLQQKMDIKKAKMWTPAFFRLEIDGCDCTKVNKVDAITIKQKVTQNAVGQLRDYQSEASYVEVPNLVITMAESHSDDFYQWHQQFVVMGKCDQGNEKGGALHYLAADATTELFTINFVQLGIFKISPEKVEAGGEPVRRVKIEMYCEDMKFGYDKTQQTFA